MDCAINVLKCGFLWHVLQLRSGWWHRQSDTERVACLHEKCLRLEAGGDVSLFHTVLESVFHLNTDRYTETGRDRRRSQTVFKLGLRRNAARVVWPGLWCWTLIAAWITLAVFVFCVDPVTPVGAWHTYAGGLVICAAVQSQQVRLSLDKLSEVTEEMWRCSSFTSLCIIYSFNSYKCFTFSVTRKHAHHNNFFYWASLFMFQPCPYFSRKKFLLTLFVAA